MKLGRMLVAGLVGVVAFKVMVGTLFPLLGLLYTLLTFAVKALIVVAIVAFLVQLLQDRRASSPTS